MSGQPGLVVALSLTMVVACGHAPSGGSAANSAQLPAFLNALTASQVVDDFTKAGLPTSNVRDVTAQECPRVKCVQAISTDTVSVFKFPATGMGQRFTEGQPSVYQIEDLVLIFAPSVTDEVKHRYELVVERAAA